MLRGECSALQGSSPSLQLPGSMDTFPVSGNSVRAEKPPRAGGTGLALAELRWQGQFLLLEGCCHSSGWHHCSGISSFLWLCLVPGDLEQDLELLTPLRLTASLSLCSSVYWDYAMTIRLEEIVYLHCHQQGKARAGAVGAVSL